MTASPTPSEMTPEELLRRVEAGDVIQVLDVRAPHRLAAGGHIDVIPTDRFFNMAGSQVRALDDLDQIGIARDQPVAVVCGHGNSSKPIAALLHERGFAASSLVGGMAGWMMTAHPRALPAPTGLDHLIQLDRVGKGALAYLLVSDGQALVIDPARNIELYTTRARELGAEIVGVADTHVHADYISGGPALAAQLGVPYYLHPADNAHVYEGTPGKLDISPIEDGGTISVGRAILEVMHTPGHTEGSVTLLLGDEAAFTGDFIFINSLGRPDLGGNVDAWAALLWKTVCRARESLPGEIMIYPAHYASDAERAENRTISATFEAIRAESEPLAMKSEEEFIAWVKGRTSSFPEAYRRIKVANVGLLEITDEEAEELEVGKNECAA